MKRALVTGGCGFIGSNLTKELVKQGWQVDIIDDMSNGHIELLDGLDCRYMPNSGFIKAYNLHYKDLNKKRPINEVVVIHDDFACNFILNHIKAL